MADLDYIDGSGSDEEEHVQNFSINTSVLTITLCTLYSILFCFGFVGNMWVVSVILYIMKYLRNKMQNTSVFLYILMLAIVDTMVLLNIPMLVADMALGRWIFGYHLCKMYWTVESVNKVLSKFIIAAMSLDRYLTICRRESQYFIKSCKGTVFVVGSLAIVVCGAMYPVYVHAEEVVFEEIFDSENETEMVVQSTITKCVLQMPDETMKIFAICMIIFGFCVPSTIITVFNCFVLRRLYNHAHSLGCHHSHIPLRRVTMAIFLLMLFYFISWMPFWITTVYTAFTKRDMMTPVELYLLYGAHFFVYVNSAVNWVLYACMNNNLKKSRELATKRNAETLGRRISRSHLLSQNEKKVVLSKSASIIKYGSNSKVSTHL